MKREEVRELLCRIPFEVDGHGPTAVFCGRSAITVEIRGRRQSPMCGAASFGSGSLF